MYVDRVICDELTDDEDTLIIVTADHEHALALNGYCGRGSDIMGLCYDVAQRGDKHSDDLVLGSDGKPFTIVGYLNGAGSVLVEQEDGTYAAPEGRPEFLWHERKRAPGMKKLRQTKTSKFPNPF